MGSDICIVLYWYSYQVTFYVNPCIFATLGSIFDSQLSWKSCKAQLARWSHEVVLFPERTTHPPIHPPTISIFVSLSVRCVPPSVSVWPTQWPYQCLLVFPSGASPPLCLSVVAKCLLVFPSSASPLKIWQVPACKMDLIWPTQLGLWV